MNDSTQVQELIEMEKSSSDRREFHRNSLELFQSMKSDLDFLDQTVRQSFTDPNYLNQEWSLYNIPNLPIVDTEDLSLKYHVFVPLQNHIPGSAASTIHHHSNYLLTTTAVLGSGYETFIFEQLKEEERRLEEIPLKIQEHLTESENTQSFVDAWQPHLVFNPSELSATLIMWSTDKKRATDGLRQNRVLKHFKGPLRKMIAALGLENTFGITARTLQYYVENGQFVAIDEDEFFEPTRKAVGPEVNIYSIQAIFAFLQRSGWRNKPFLEKMLKANEVPSYYHQFIQMLLSEEPIPDVYAKETINIPKGGFLKQEVIAAHSKSWGKEF